MTRRTAVLVTGALLLVVFGLAGALVPVPYVAEVPGPTYNTLGDIDGNQIITVTGREAKQTSGNLNLTTVGIPSRALTLVGAVQGWLDDEVTVVPREQVYPSGQSQQQTQDENRQAFLTSEQSARAAALGELGYPTGIVVDGLSDGSPSDGVLQADDVLTAVDGTKTADTDELTTVLAGIEPGTQVPVSYLRSGKKGTGTVTTAKASSGNGSALGVLVIESPYAPFDVDVAVSDVGGPSAGLMLTLGILDKVGNTDLTAGKVIAGTGTIAADGTVGAIGGIPLKMIAARNIRAELFLVPADNCAEAKANAQPGLPLARVATVDDALTALADLRSGTTPPSC